MVKGKRPDKTFRPEITYEEWIESNEKINMWLGQYDIVTLLNENNGLVKIENFLPDFVAEGALKAVESIPEEEWEITEANHTYEDNDIQHKFWSTEDAEAVADLRRVLWMLLPKKFPSFSAARYCKSNHIAKHDDRAHIPIGMADGEVEIYSREFAAIYYLTKDWKHQYGGQLMDLATGDAYSPEFNSLIVFRVPRDHMVTAVKTAMPRYSIFGWWLEQGELYSLENEIGTEVRFKKKYGISFYQ
ncbi:hypothetical protein CYMTET_51474 [Cymbomonas tetramitiformis]|uniref:Prolyl 4-hydroxylase alpha subunit domain-containing protein n=1 Tax=Cymbomonas tetramitiformis TaxID=36881 RepID=A0AAE0ES31_9CHLO|nr:hypothetical protein CYMTET_51474 [Cymbomonas tetramitiformis]|eukprot:gene8836-10473_t